MKKLRTGTTEAALDWKALLGLPMVLIMRKIEEEGGSKSLSLLKQVCKEWQDSCLEVMEYTSESPQTSKALLTVCNASPSRSGTLTSGEIVEGVGSNPPSTLPSEVQLFRILERKSSSEYEGDDGSDEEEVNELHEAEEAEESEEETSSMEAEEIEEEHEVEGESEEEEEEESSEEEDLEEEEMEEAEEEADADDSQSIKDLTVICKDVVPDCFADARFAIVTRLRLAWKRGFPHGIPDLLQYLPKLKDLRVGHCSSDASSQPDYRAFCGIPKLTSLRLSEGSLPYLDYERPDLADLTLLELTNINGDMDWLVRLDVPRLASLKLKSSDFWCRQGRMQLMQYCMPRSPSFPSLRELTVDDCHSLLITCGGSKLRALSCSPLLSARKQAPDIFSIVLHYENLTKLELQSYKYVADTRPDFTELRNLKLQELVIRSCPGMAYDILVPDSQKHFSHLRKLCIWEDSHTQEIDDFRHALNRIYFRAGDVLDYRKLGRAVLTLPKLTQLSGVGKLFVLAERDNWKGWHISRKAPRRAKWPSADDMTVWLRDSN